ncbi:MAG: hypothetical protein ACRC1D_03380, partial [Culicoidibacterales bacterium]
MIRKNGVPHRWIDEPYTIKAFQNGNIEFLELIPNPDKIIISLFQTPYSTMQGYADSTNCFCNAGNGNIVVDVDSLIGGSGISLARTDTTITIFNTGDLSNTNELQSYSHSGTSTYVNTLSNGGGSWSLTGGGIAVVSQTGGSVTVTATEVDGSTSNEGVIGVGAGIATSSVITSNSAGSNGVTINVGGINTITETVSSNGGQI